MATGPIKISQMSSAAALTGAETVPLVQSGGNVRTTLTNILDVADLYLASPTATARPITDHMQDFVSVKDYGAVGDGVTDDTEAFISAIEAADKIFIPRGTYIVNETLNIKKTIMLYGETGTQAAATYPSVLQFANGIVGIFLHRNDTYATTTGVPEYPTAVTGGADGSIIANLEIRRGNGSNATPDGTSHGVWLKCRASVQDCLIWGWAGDDVHIVATASSVDPYVRGNANNWDMARCRLRNGYNGLFVDGADVNVGCGLHIDSSANQNVGIWDSSFLGCTWVAPHCNGNTGDDIVHDNVNAPSVFIGMYIESGGSATFTRPAFIIGGQLAGVTISGTYYSLDSLPDFVADGGCSFVGATSGTGRYTTVWNQGAASATRAAGYAFQIGTPASNMMAGSVYARTTASNVTNRSAVGMEIFNGTSGLYEVAFECNGGTANVIGPGTDNLWKLGQASFRFTEVFAVNGTINTSDGREKADREGVEMDERNWAVSSFTPAELAAAKMLSKEIGVYKWRDAIAKKGDGARLHIGISVQRVIEVMEMNGLDAFAYGFVCYDKWEAEPEAVDDGVVIRPAIPAGDRYSLRNDELLHFIARGFEERLAALEAAQ